MKRILIGSLYTPAPLLEEAESLKRLLSAEGIAAEVVEEETVGIDWTGPEPGHVKVSLEVPDAHEERARALVAAAQSNVPPESES